MQVDGPAQYETIHPCVDAGGLVGWILIGWILTHRTGITVPPSPGAFIARDDQSVGVPGSAAGATVCGLAVLVGGGAGCEVQVSEIRGSETGVAGTVATTVPAPLIPTTVAPAVAEAPGAASTTMPPVGAEESSATPFDAKRTVATSEPTQTATQATGEPSTPPNVPSPRTVRLWGADGALVGRGT